MAEIRNKEDDKTVVLSVGASHSQSSDSIVFESKSLMIRISLNHIIADLVVEQDDSNGTPDVSDHRMNNC